MLPFDLLSERQLAALRSMCAGRSHHETAERVGVSSATIANRVISAYETLDVGASSPGCLVCYELGKHDAAATRVYPMVDFYGKDADKRYRKHLNKWARDHGWIRMPEDDWWEDDDDA